MVEAEPLDIKLNSGEQLDFSMGEGDITDTKVSSPLDPTKLDALKETQELEPLDENEELNRTTMADLRAELLDLEADLPQAAMCSPRGSEERRANWRTMLAARCNTSRDLAMAVLLLDIMISGQYLSVGWRVWASPSQLLAHTNTVAAAAFLIRSLTKSLQKKPISKLKERERRAQLTRDRRANQGREQCQSGSLSDNWNVGASHRAAGSTSSVQDSAKRAATDDFVRRSTRRR
eukprot:CAMPEP_0196594856 /NCGR_PEP_ID=MMETSP1081-20130531/79453_1 /TAXON_ID=36882 /ORGANISM="Pyramimonas amylifera, Strain CCMP720" /LENGTH=233 /DNA_ID=CAMNT_0041919231 /DNA_START=66 /DNA_END=764 /DNA_ORIENTATION=-